MRYTEILPAAPIRSRIRCYWFLTGTRSSSTPAAPALPDGSPELIFNFGDPVQALDVGSTQPRASFIGQITQPFLVAPAGTLDLVGVRFEAHGAAPWLGPAEWLRDRWIDATEIGGLGADRLGDRLAETATIGARAELLDRHFLAAEPNANRRADRRVAGAVAMIRATGGTLSLDRVLDALGANARRLERGFAAEAGLSPKLFLRICRFQRVFAAWQRAPGSWARTAIECGYYDQSHLVRDFRQFAGDAPARFVDSGPEFSRLFTALRPR